MQKTHILKLFSATGNVIIFDGYIVRLSDLSFSFIEKKAKPDENTLIKFASVQELKSTISVPADITPLH